MISYEEKIESYCDLILDRNFNNITCLENFIDEIRIYSNTIECSSFQDKLNTVVEPRNIFFDNVSNDSISLLTLSSVSTVSSDNFLVHYDSSTTSRTEAVDVANYFETIRTQYLNMGFNSPILEKSQSRYRVYMDPAPSSNGSLASTFKVNTSGNTCASYIYLYNYNTLDDLMRESIAHEYFHAIQNSYNHQSGWFKEACANWGAVNTCAVYPNSIAWIRSFINNSTNVSMPSLDGYDAVVFPLTIQKNYGGTRTIRNIYEEYSRYSDSIDLSTLTMVVGDGIVRSGFSNSFKDAYRSMATFMLRPQVWLNSVINTSSLSNVRVTSTWTASTSSTQTFTGSLDYLSSLYYEIKLPSSVSTGNVKINIDFKNAKGAVQTYTIDKNNEHQILYPNTSASGICNVERTDIGSEIDRLYVVLSNLDYSSTINFEVNISYGSIKDTISFTSSTRYLEEICYISDGGYKEYSVNFVTSGSKTIQTFCSYDTKIELYSASGTLLVNNDDSGYSLNGLICYQVSANTTYKIRVYYYSSSVNGYTKLSITPAYGELKSGKTSLSTYTDIYALTNSVNIIWSSGFQQNYVKMATYKPNMSGNYVFNLTSTYDNYIYVIDPRNNEILINNMDYNDDGNGLNARLTKHLEEGVEYLIIISKYNPGMSLSSTDNSSMQLQINRTGLPTYFNNPRYLNLSLVARSGFIIYNWDVKINNPNPFAVQVTYNSKMCYGNDAINYTNLKDLVTITIPANGSQTVRINGNGNAGWIATCIDYAYNGSNYRRITCANGLSKNLTMNTPVNNQIDYR